MFYSLWFFGTVLLINSSVESRHVERNKRQIPHAVFTVDDYIEMKHQPFHNPPVIIDRPQGDPQNAITEYGVLNMGNGVTLPSYIIADIRKRHTNSRSRGCTQSIHQHLVQNMNFQRCDENGHLLAHILGGPTAIYNFIPQTAVFNRGAGSTDQDIKSAWYTLETDIKKFLRAHPNGKCLFKLVVHYDFANLAMPRRPTHVSLRYSLKGDINHAHPDDDESDNLTFSNAPSLTTCNPSWHESTSYFC